LRYDFAFKSTIEDAEWELSMSTVMSQDGSSIWIMAWLDELPKSAADVPRTALLRLLSDNDKLGKGKFFAYIAPNRRFVLQRVLPNENITAATFRAALDDLGQSVVGTHAHWSVANWASTTSEDPAAAARTAAPIKGSTPQAPAAGAARPAAGTPATTQSQTARPLQSAVNDSKFGAVPKK
ncbi:MAG TPA: type III secretion system chaperone, partial [Schlesneria sp.]